MKNRIKCCELDPSTHARSSHRSAFIDHSVRANWNRYNPSERTCVDRKMTLEIRKNTKISSKLKENN